MLQAMAEPWFEFWGELDMINAQIDQTCIFEGID